MLHCLLMSSPFGIFPLFRWLNEAGLRRFVQNKDSQGLLVFLFLSLLLFGEAQYGSLILHSQWSRTQKPNSSITSWSLQCDVQVCSALSSCCGLRPTTTVPYSAALLPSLLHSAVANNTNWKHMTWLEGFIQFLIFDSGSQRDSI